MSQQLVLSDLMADLSTEEQQLIAGGQFLDDNNEDGSLSNLPDTGREGSSNIDGGNTRVYRIRSAGVLRIRRVR